MHTYIHTSISIYIYLYIGLSIYIYIYLSISIYIYVSIISIYIYQYISIYLSICRPTAIPSCRPTQQPLSKPSAQPTSQFTNAMSGTTRSAFERRICCTLWLNYWWILAVMSLLQVSWSNARQRSPRSTRTRSWTDTPRSSPARSAIPTAFLRWSENLISKLCTKVPSKRLDNMKGEQELRWLQSPPMGSARWYCRSYSGISISNPFRTKQLFHIVRSAIDAIDTSKYW